MEHNKRPYFMTNKDWYYINDDEDDVDYGYKLTDKAPPEAVESYKKFYEELESGLEDD